MLIKHGYGVPVTAVGQYSLPDAPVYSRGVREGEPDQYGMTADVGSPAEKTVYGAAVNEILLEISDTMTMEDMLWELLSWYQENSHWTFGGIDSIKREGNTLRIVLYAGISSNRNPFFFVSAQEDGTRTVGRIYAALKDPVKMRWVYQEYQPQGDYSFQVERQYYFESGNGRRYYVDAVLTPAALM